MMRLWALALNTFREAVRDRVLHSILFFGAATVILSIVFKDITIGDQAKVVRSVAHSGVDIFASIIAPVPSLRSSGIRSAGIRYELSSFTCA